MLRKTLTKMPTKCYNALWTKNMRNPGACKPLTTRVKLVLLVVNSVKFQRFLRGYFLAFASTDATCLKKLISDPVRSLKEAFSENLVKFSDCQTFSLFDPLVPKGSPFDK